METCHVLTPSWALGPFIEVATTSTPDHIYFQLSFTSDPEFNSRCFTGSQCHRPIAFSQRHIIHAFNGAGRALPLTVMLINGLQPT